MFGRILEHPAGDILLRLALAIVAFVTMFHPDDRVATAAAVFLLSAMIYGIWRHRQVAAPKVAMQSQAAG